MAGDYESAIEKGISKKLMKKVVKEREFERKIFALSDDLEADERSEMDMLKESAEPRNPITGSADDCSRAMRGHAATAEP
jgi:hypothetical protein